MRVNVTVAHDIGVSVRVSEYFVDYIPDGHKQVFIKSGFLFKYKNNKIFTESKLAGTEATARKVILVSLKSLLISITP